MRRLFARQRSQDTSQHQRTAPPRRSWKASSILLTAVLLLAPMLSAPTAAMAVGGTLNLTVDAVDATVPSGAGASFRVQWTCSGAGSCDGAQIRIPVPTAMPGDTAFPGGVPLTVTSQSQVSIDGTDIPGSGTIVGTAPTQELLWTFPATVATGKSGAVTFTLTAPNKVTPDGATIGPVATFTATGAAPVTDTATTTVTAKSSLAIQKVKSAPTDVPYVDQQVTYRIAFGYDSQMPANPGAPYSRTMADVCADLGTQALQNIVVVDTLPAGAQFVNASHGGTYDAGTNTITWSLGSSIDDTTYACKPYNGTTSWTGQPLTVTAVYPSGTFSANPDPAAVTNNVKVTANPWGQPDKPMQNAASTGHALRAGSAGASVAKQPGYDWAVGAPLYRGVATKQNSIYNLDARSNDSKPAHWQVTDMMPCALTSPQNTSNTGCATPAFTDLTFSADMLFDQLAITYTTNTGATGVCTIPAGTSLSDTTKRFCAGTDANTPIALPAGQWITKFEIDTQIPPFGGGHVFIHGTPSTSIPTDNVSTTYVNPSLDVTRSDVHPWFVTVENCTAVNRITFQDGRVWNPVPNPQVAADNGGICGYRQVMTNPFQLRPVKSMYDPAIPPANRPAVPAVPTGDTLTVDLSLGRDIWSGAPRGVIDQSTFTPTVTEYLPANLTFLPDSLVMAATSSANQAFVTALGTPHVDTQMVTVNGEQRQKITVTFPNASITSSATMGRAAIVRFQVKVNDGVPAGTYTNSFLLTGAEGGAGVADTYLTCPTGTMVDANLQPTTDRAVAVGCLASSQYTVLPVPGVSTDKKVQGLYDASALSAPNVGSTNIGGSASYTIDMKNTGSVDITNVVAYDLLPRIGDTLTVPGNNQPRNSAFPVQLTGPVVAPAGATVQYSTALNPCRGELAGTGGGTTASAPAGCTNDWSAAPAGGNFAAVTAIRIDFGSTVFPAGHTEQLTLPVKAIGPNTTTSAALDGVAWNNVAITAREASSGKPTLPTEQSPVGLRVLPDLVWQKVDSASNALLAGSEWKLEITDGRVDDRFPMTVTDCATAPCTGLDQDPVAGQFRLTGLPWGEYKLTETLVPSGYIGLTDPVTVSLTPSTVARGTYVLDLQGQKNEKLVPGLHIAKTSDPASGSKVDPEQEITYSVVAKNTGNTPLTGVTVMDDLSDVLDNATFVTGSESASTGAAPTLSGTTLTWTGDLPVGGSVTLSYTVKVNADVVATDVLKNVVTGTSTETPSNCVEGSTDPDCSTTHTPTPKPGLHIVKTSDPASGSKVDPEQEITYSVVATNTGNTALTGVTVTDDLADVLDNATFVSGSESASTGAAPTVSGSTLTWTGDLPVGGSVTLSYKVKVNVDVVATDVLKNVVTGTSTETPSNCVAETGNGGGNGNNGNGRIARLSLRGVVLAQAAADDPDCSTTHTPTPKPGLHIVKTSDPASGSTVDAGQEITYSVVAENTGNTVLTGVTVNDDLSDVLDNATFVVGSESATVGGAPTISGTTLTWTGDLPVGGSVTLSYTVKVNADVVATDVLRNVVTGGTPETPSNCVEGSDDPDCSTTHPPTPKPGLHIVKTSDPASGSTVDAGQEITYSVVAENTGNTVLTDVTVTDDLSDVLDNATFVTGSESASTGAAPTLSGTTLTWTGDLPVGGSVTLSYTVKVNADVVATDVLRNVVTGGTPETPSNCVEGSDDPDCSTTHPPTPTPGLHIVKTSDPASGSTVDPGQRITYSVVATNTGNAALTGVTVTDDLSDVLDNATLVAGSESASTGAAPTLSGSTLTWTGDLPVGGSVTLTYTVTVNADVAASDVLKNVVFGSAPGVPSNCVEGSTDPDCTTTHTPVPKPTPSATPPATPELRLVKTSDPKSGSAVSPGQDITYTVRVTNTGTVDIDEVAVTDDLTDVLDDTTLKSGSITVDSGTAPVLTGTTLTWKGSIAAGQTVTIRYTVTVKAQLAASAKIANYVFASAPGVQVNCAKGSTAPECTTIHTRTGQLPTTGQDLGAGPALALGILALGGLLVIWTAHRTRRAAAERSMQA